MEKLKGKRYWDSLLRCIRVSVKVGKWRWAEDGQLVNGPKLAETKAHSLIMIEEPSPL